MNGIIKIGCFILLMGIINCINCIEIGDMDLMRLKREKAQPEAECIDPASRYHIEKGGRGEEKEVFLLDGKCFDDCRVRYNQNGQQNKSLWDRFKGIFDSVHGVTQQVEKKEKLKLVCFLKCFCQN